MDNLQLRKIKDLSFREWFKDYPIEITSGALVINDENEETYLTLTIYNVGKQYLASVYFEIICFDDAGDPVKINDSNIINYAYMNLEVKPTNFFGVDKYIKLTGPSVRKTDIKLTKAVYTNGEVYRVSEFTSPFSKPQLISIDTLEMPLRSYLFNEVLPLVLIDKEKVKFIPGMVKDDVWSCCCGRLNGIEEEVCTRCGLNKDIVFKTINVEVLSNSYEAHKRVIIEREKATESERQKKSAHERQKRIKRNKIIIALVIIFSVIGASTPFIIKEVLYRQAIRFTVNGNYDEADKIYKKIIDYKDSVKQLKENRYKQAQSYFQIKDYVNALNALEKLDYSDNKASEMRNEIKYQAGKEALNNKDFRTTYNYLLSLNYKDSYELLKKSYYEEALDFYEKYKTNLKSEYMRNAYRLMMEVRAGYADVDKLLLEFKNELNNSIYREAKELFDKKYFVEARSLFNELKDYKDTKKYLDSKYYKIEGKWLRYRSYYYFVLEPQGQIRYFYKREDRYGLEHFQSYIYNWSKTEDFAYGYENINYWNKISSVNDSQGGKLIINGFEEYEFIDKNIANIVADVKAEEAIERARVEPAIGMTEYEVRNSTWGSPKDINKTTTAYSTYEQWVYRNYRYIYFENGIVTSIQD